MVGKSDFFHWKLKVFKTLINLWIPLDCSHHTFIATTTIKTTTDNRICRTKTCLIRHQASFFTHTHKKHFLFAFFLSDIALVVSFVVVVVRLKSIKLNGFEGKKERKGKRERKWMKRRTEIYMPTIFWIQKREEKKRSERERGVEWKRWWWRQRQRQHSLYKIVTIKPPPPTHCFTQWMNGSCAIIIKITRREIG